MGLLERLFGAGLFGQAPKTSLLDPRLAAIQERFAAFNPARPLTELGFTVIDTELTGLDPSRAEIVSIGAVTVKGLCLELGSTFYSLVRPRGEMATPSTLIHRLTCEDLTCAPDLGEVLPRFLDFIGDTLLVGHHIALDMGFINAAARRLLGGELTTPCLDTLRLAQKFEETREPGAAPGHTDHISYNLRDLAKRYGLPRFTAHNSLADAMQTGYLFLYLVGKLRGGKAATLDGLWRSGRKWWQA